MTSVPSRGQLEGLFRAALDAVDPSAAVARVVHRSGPTLSFDGLVAPDGVRFQVLAAGKAAAPMASAFESLAGDRLRGGLVVTKAGHGLPRASLSVREAGHPVPDARSERAGRDALDQARRGHPEDWLVVLLSGGASSLLCAPVEGLPRRDLEETTRVLLRGGAGIDELNTLRKHLTRVGGGKLAQAAVARQIVVLAISDVPGDRLDLIGSGPCAPDTTGFQEALEIVRKFEGRGERLPAGVHTILDQGVSGERAGNPKPGDACLARVSSCIVASNANALEAARVAARSEGLQAIVLADALQGEAREVGGRLIGLGRATATRSPLVLLAGGETTVTVRGNGRGGRNQELALAAAVALDGDSRISLLAVGSDGTDGPTDAAGAYADGGTVARGRACGVDAGRALARNDAYGFFDAEGGLLRTGPTRTNVMDLTFVGVTS